MELTKQLEEAGYKQLHAINAEELIKQLLQQGTTREKHAIPTIIRKHDIKPEELPATPEAKKILAITQQLLKEHHINKQLPQTTQTYTKEEYEAYKQDFTLQLELDKQQHQQTQEHARKQRAQEHALQTLFTKKEQEIIKAMQQNQPVNKTAYEYYSRKTKKKLHAIIQLHEFALSLQTTNPQKNTKTNR